MLWFQSKKFRISIYFKSSLNSKFLSEVVKNKIVEFNRLPDIVCSEFAWLTQSLVLTTALQCISEVRSNTFLLLESYNKSLDPAYLTHKALLPIPNEAEEHLVDIIGSDIKAILKARGIVEHLRDNLLPKYMDATFTASKYPFEIPNSDKMPSLKIPGEIDKTILKTIILNGIEQVFFQKGQPFSEQILFSKKCHLSLTATLTADKALAKKSDIAFAILTTIKPTYQLSNFNLGLGTIVKEEPSGNYWLCVQPKCDSTRIHTKKRAFLFLKLSNSDEGNFDIVVDVLNPAYLKIDYRVYHSKMYDFYSDTQGNSSSYMDNGIVKFKRGDNQNMIWVAELKNDYAQSISNTFSMELSRVGLDMSEWLRRNS